MTDVPARPPPAAAALPRGVTKAVPRKDPLPLRIWKRHFPPVRLVWIFLLVIVWNAQGFVNRAVAEPLLALPLICAAVDLGLQFTRFPRLRFPDAALGNGLFLAIILWPATISLEFAAIAAATVGLRHLVRRGGHPLLNPAALGVTIAATLFALPQPWHVGTTLDQTVLVAILGLILWSRAWHTWRLWGVYFAANLSATALIAFLLGGAGSLGLALPPVLMGSAPVFYGMFMVTEPRTAPSARGRMILFGALVGVLAAGLPALLSEYPEVSALGVLAPYLALFIGNLLALTGRAPGAARRPAPAVPAVTRPKPRPE
ncbi:MAG TPA: hypothetical protein VJS68_02080 [Thermoplasmata archaeon]|nr:hypothetical protein [Thermoplasmata archaeon]